MGGEGYRAHGLDCVCGKKHIHKNKQKLKETKIKRNTKETQLWDNIHLFPDYSCIIFLLSINELCLQNMSV